MSDFAQESGHWYQPDGTPAYTIVGANGKERPTTLRDARKHGYVPSVTTIIRLMAAPGLEQWKRRQLLLAALTTPRGEDSEDDWLKRINQSAADEAARAAEMGTRIHAAIEVAFRDCLYDVETSEWSMATVYKIEEHFGKHDWQAERSFASPLGYGGKLDLHANEVLIDIKTKDFGPDDKNLAYDEMAMQLAAYRMGMGFRNPQAVRCANVFVSRNNPGLVKVHEWTEDDLQRGWTMFDCLLRLWKAKNNV